MGAVDEIIQDLNIDQLAEQLGTEPAIAEAAIRQAVPSLFNGLQTNVMDGGSASLAQALTQHADSQLLDGGVNLDDVDVADGEKIVQHIYANDPGQLQALAGGGSGMLGGLMKKLLPILAPIVMSYIAKKLGMGSSRSQSTQSQGGGLGDLLGPILGGILGGGAAGGLGDILSGGQGGGQAPASQQQSSGDIFGDILGQILNGGGAAPQAQEPSGNFGQADQGPFNTNPGGGQDDGEPRVDMSDTGDDSGQNRQQQQGGTLGDILGQILGGR